MLPHISELYSRMGCIIASNRCVAVLMLGGSLPKDLNSLNSALEDLSFRFSVALLKVPLLLKIMPRYFISFTVS